MSKQDDPLELMETIERADLAAELENAGLGLDSLPEWKRLRAAIEAQQTKLAVEGDAADRLVDRAKWLEAQDEADLLRAGLQEVHALADGGESSMQEIVEICRAWLTEADRKEANE